MEHRIALQSNFNERSGAGVTRCFTVLGMNLKNTRTLLDRYRHLFITDAGELTLQHGFDVGDGWFQLLDDVLASLQGALQSELNRLDMTRLSSGFESAATIACETDVALARAGTPHVVDVKQKLGGLRVQLQFAHDRLPRALPFAYGVLHLANRVSLRTCEVCGAAGSLQKQAWLHVTCDAHVLTPMS